MSRPCSPSAPTSSRAIATRRWASRHGEGIEEAEFCQAIFEYFADEGPTLAADQPIKSFSGGKAMVQKLPVGPLLGIMPWNFPFYQIARFAAPNLMLGNTIILKHAESVPRCALAVEQIMKDAGVPEGVYVNVFATHDQIETIIADPRDPGRLADRLGARRSGRRRAGRQEPEEVRPGARWLRSDDRARQRRPGQRHRQRVGLPDVQHRAGLQLQQADDRDGGPVRRLRQPR